MVDRSFDGGFSIESIIELNILDNV
jgi:hypothetical protein